MMLLAALAGAGGTLARYLLSGLVQQRLDGDLPVGTLAVNLSGALLIGAVVGIDHLQSRPPSSPPASSAGSPPSPPG